MGADHLLLSRSVIGPKGMSGRLFIPKILRGGGMHGTDVAIRRSILLEWSPSGAALYSWGRLKKTYRYVAGLIWTRFGWLVDSILFAKVALFPNKQYLGMRVPTTPATTDPVWIPTRILT